MELPLHDERWNRENQRLHICNQRRARDELLTFSFDDGNEDDVRLVRIMNSYGLKGTFNLNSGSLTKTVNWKYDGFSADLESYLPFP